MYFTMMGLTGDGWPQVRALLESIEPGAGTHCVERREDEDRYFWRHVRLGVEISVWKLPASE